MSMITIGIRKQDQNWTRNITCHEHPDVRFRQVWGPAEVLYRAMNRIGRPSGFFSNAHLPPAAPPADVLHFWRTISYAATPWIVSTSVGLPFGWPPARWERGVGQLASKRCRRILVVSNYARRWQEKKAERFPQHAEAVFSKVEHLPPPQQLIVQRYEQKELPQDWLVVTLVGKHFFRKGGYETLRAVCSLLAQGAKIRFNIVSPLAFDDHLGPMEVRKREALDLIEQHPSITHHPRLTNEEVLDLFRRSHIGMLPSFVETYGYSVLEAQAAGCATITSDVGAFPEINPEGTGWRIKLCSDGPQVSTHVDEELSRSAEAQIQQVLMAASANPAVVRQKAEAALERIRRVHDPMAHASRLRRLYREAVTGATLRRENQEGHKCRSC